MDGNITLQYVAEFFALMGIIRIGFTAGFQGEMDRLHHVFLRIGNDPFDFILKLCIVFLKVIGFSEYDLFFRAFIEELADRGPKTL